MVGSPMAGGPGTGGGFEHPTSPTVNKTKVNALNNPFGFNEALLSSPCLARIEHG